MNDRPIRRTDSVKIKLSPELMDRLDLQAQQFGMAPSTLCAFAVAEWLQNRERNERLARTAVLDAARSSAGDTMNSVVKMFGEGGLEDTVKSLVLSLQKGRIQTTALDGEASPGTRSCGRIPPPEAAISAPRPGACQVPDRRPQLHGLGSGRSEAPGPQLGETGRGPPLDARKGALRCRLLVGGVFPHRLPHGECGVWGRAPRPLTCNHGATTPNGLPVNAQGYPLPSPGGGFPLTFGPL